MNTGFLSPVEVEKFKKIVESYMPSKEIIDIFYKSDFAVIAGPAVSGKDTLREGLLSDYPKFYRKILSLTTRRPREQETDTYKFVSVEDMMKLAEQKELLQLALVHNQQVSATDLSEIKNIPDGKIGLSILIVQAEQKLYEFKPDMKTIFMIPPSLEDLVKRIRQDRVSDESEIRRRLASAKREIEIALNTERYYLLVSDIQKDVRIKADEFLRFGRKDTEEEKRARKICHEILEKLN